MWCYGVWGIVVGAGYIILGVYKKFEEVINGVLRGLCVKGIVSTRIKDERRVPRSWQWMFNWRRRAKSRRNWKIVKRRGGFGK